MAVSIDIVYQQVLAAISKERRGELTPPHFNILAAKAQNDIFEKTLYDYQTAIREQSDSLPMLREKFHDLRASGLVSTTGVLPATPHFLETISRGATVTSRTIRVTPGAGSDVLEYDVANNLLQKTQIALRGVYEGSDATLWIVYIFRTGESPTPATNYFSNFGSATIEVSTTATVLEVATSIANAINNESPFHSAELNGTEIVISYNEVIPISSNESIMNFGSNASLTIETTETSGGVIYEEVDQEHFDYVVGAPKIKPTVDRPIYCRKPGYMNQINVSPSITEGTKPTAVYITKPSDPKWVGTTDGVYFKKSTVTNFSLHPSEESSLVNRILELAGLALDEPGLSNAAVQSEAAVENDKNN